MGEEMKITDLPIPSVLKEFYIHDKIISLYPPQADVVTKGLFNNINLLISIPTASGKTLMAELAMLTAILEHHGKALYIVPLKALASEKHERFCRFEELGPFNGKTLTTAISTSDFRSKGEKLAESDIIVVTSEKADSLIRNKAPWIENISVVVIDELHLIGDKDRGATLEMVIAKLRRINPKIRFIGLSATIGNPEHLATWLKAELIVSEWRPIKLKEGVFYDNEILFDETTRLVRVKNKDDVNALVIDMVLEGGQTLVFCVSRKSAESKAKNIANELNLLLDKDTKLKLESISAKINGDDSKAAKDLAKSISCGVAFHHAGLVDNLRHIVESGFRDGLIKVIFSTPTLAAGLNLPARRVIVQGYKRYNSFLNRMDDISVIDYKQMAGRAGRPQLDPYGECVIVPSGGKQNEFERVADVFIHGYPEKILSSFAGVKPLRIHMLSSIASGFVNNVPEFNILLNETFLPYISALDKYFTQELIDKTVLEVRNYLIDEKMIVMDSHGSLSATPLGMIISRLCLNPTTGALIMRGLQEIENTGIKISDMTLLHIISLVDDIEKIRFYKAADTEIITQIFKTHEKELVKFEDLITSRQKTFEEIVEPLKIADIIRMWITEVKESAIAESWGIGEGDVHSIVEQSKRIASAMYLIGQLQENETIVKMTRVLSVRIAKGIKPELIGLTKTHGIGRVFARRLYSAGITTAQKHEELKASDPATLHSILYPKKYKTPDATPKPPAGIPMPIPIKQPVLQSRQKSFADY